MLGQDSQTAAALLVGRLDRSALCPDRALPRKPTAELISSSLVAFGLPFMTPVYHDRWRM